MKGKVFIGWSGTTAVAQCVKKYLDSCGYKGVIGGNLYNDTDCLGIGDTVIRQMKECNQAIMLFQNKKTEQNVSIGVTNNLFFELGYVLAEMGTKKIHCFRSSKEDVVLPSDFDNAYLKAIDYGNSDDDFAKGIVDYFLTRQKLRIEENRMDLINNRSIIHDMIACHYDHSKCSDYELAQYILVYAQAAHMFRDEDRIGSEIVKFKNAYQSKFSEELQIAVGISLAFFNFINKIQVKTNKSPFIELDPQCEIEDIYNLLFKKLEKIESDNTTVANIEASQIMAVDVFAEFARIMMNEHLAYSCMLRADDDSCSPASRKKYLEKSIAYANATLEHINSNENKVSDDDLMKLLRAYIYRNLFSSLSAIGGDKEEIEHYLEQTFTVRQELFHKYENGAIDSKLFDNFKMEYYLAMSEYVPYEQDDERKENYLSKLKNYLEDVKTDKGNNKSLYIDKIEENYKDANNQTKITAD